jgi:hypothetical protein
MGRCCRQSTSTRSTRYLTGSHCPSRQLKAVLDYFDCLKRRDFETIPTPNFALPASSGFPARTKSEDIKHLQDYLKGAPLEVFNRQPRFGEVTALKSIMYGVNENKEIWVQVRTFPCPFWDDPHARAVP